MCNSCKLVYLKSYVLENANFRPISKICYFHLTNYKPRQRTTKNLKLKRILTFPQIKETKKKGMKLKNKETQEIKKMESDRLIKGGNMTTFKEYSREGEGAASQAK